MFIYFVTFLSHVVSLRANCFSCVQRGISTPSCTPVRGWTQLMPWALEALAPMVVMHRVVVLKHPLRELPTLRREPNLHHLPSHSHPKYKIIFRFCSNHVQLVGQREENVAALSCSPQPSFQFRAC